MYIVTQNVDWLSWSLAKPIWFFNDKVWQETKSPIPNYDRAEMSNTGIFHLWHSRHDDVKHHYIASADALQLIRNNNYTDAHIVKWVLEHAQISRIDIAITSQKEDGTPHGFNPHALAWAVRDGRLKSRMKPAKDVTEDMKTQTKYIGNRKTRKRLFRAYDKGADNDELANILIRYELETRSGTKTIAREVVKGTSFGSIIKRYVDFPDVAVWQEIMNAEPAQIKHDDNVKTPQELAAEKSASRWQWLMRSIPPTIKKALHEDEKLGIPIAENPNFAEFMREVMNAYNP